MIRGRDVRAGLRAGGLWLAGSVLLIIVGRVGGADWGSVVGLLLVPFGLLGAPGQVAVAWGNFQKPAAGFNGFVAGTLAGLGNAAAVLIIGAPLAVRQLYGPGAANPDVPWIAYSPVVM